ncbi:MAG: cation transporter, partial [Methanomassiliicoccaceae archaeon]|nr:cation transporter [Methanomassiliicoccaceae archaeon]
MTDASLENYKFQRIVVAVGALLLIIKFTAYFITNSVAIFTDAVESIVNVVAGVIGLYALFLSAKPAD